MKRVFFIVFVQSAIFSRKSLGAEEGMPQLNPEFWLSQAFWLVLVFVILYLIIWKTILPKISDNLESRKSQILENIETAELQRKESEKKIKEFEKIILESKLKAKNHFNEVRLKTLEDISNKRIVLEKDIDKEISAAEEEINNLKINSSEKIKNIAIETSNELIKQLIGEQVNNSSISAIVEEQSKKDKENQYGI